MESTKKISRKKFLQLCGTVVAGGAILGISGVLLRRNLAEEETTWYASECPFPNEKSCSNCNLRHNCTFVRPPTEETSEETIFERGVCPFPGVPCSTCELRDNCPARM